MKMKRSTFAFVVTFVAGLASAGVGRMESKPVWDLTDHGGARTLSSATAFEIPNSAIPDVTAFTVEMRFRVDSLPEGHYFKLFDQVVSETGWGLDFTTCRKRASPVRLNLAGEWYVCSFAFHKMPEGSEHTLTVTARQGWVVVYKDGVVQKKFLAKITPNLAPLKVGGPYEGPAGKEVPNFQLLGLKVWNGQEEYWGRGESREVADGYRAGKGWLVNTPVRPDAKLPNVLYVGDSISVGYTPPFRKLLKGVANAYHWMTFFQKPGRKGVPAQAIAEVMKLAKFDYVIFNNGLHSLRWTEDKVSDNEIAENYAGLADAFRAGAPEAKIVYLLTTPHSLKSNAEGKVTGLGELNPVVCRLNRLAREAMDAKGIRVLDGYALFADDFASFRGDGYHLQPAAYEKLASEIVKALGVKAANGDAL